MSMLAERKVKQKWALNPRGKAWSEDSSKFGQKILEKMGWSTGKGLGARENGITEHIKVSYKNDSKGMGFKENNDQWTENSDGFSELLQKLSENNVTESSKSGDVEESKLVSLEQKSQTSKVRVHYHKFTRGKDLSRYSEKDLANIFGRKKLEKDVKKVEKEEEINENKAEEKSSFLLNGGSMLDYFKKKLPSFGQAHGYVVGNNGVLKKPDDENESESEMRVGFGFSQKRSLECSEDITPSRKKLKKNEDYLGFSNPAFNPMSSDIKIERHNLNTITEEDDNIKEEEITEIPKRKKKERKVSRSSLESVPEVVEEEPTPKKKKSKKVDVETIAEPIATPVVETKKKKKSKKTKTEDEDNIQIDNPFFDNEDEILAEEVSNSNFEVQRKTKKKKHQVHDNPNFSEEIVEEPSIISNDFEVKRKSKKSKNKATPEELPIKSNTVSEDLEVKPKKKKKKIATDLALDNPNFDISVEDGATVSSEFEVKRKKKKKSKSSLAVDNPNFDMSTEDGSTNNQQENATDLALDNPNFDISVEDGATVSSTSEFEVKRKKKRKKSESSLAVDNPNFDMSIEDGSTNGQNGVAALDDMIGDLMLNVTSTPVAPPTNVRKNLTSSLRKQALARKKSVRFSDVNQQRTIPSVNGGCQASILDKIDGCQAEIENDLNEAKMRCVGEVGNPDGEDELLQDGATRLKFRKVTFGRSPSYLARNKSGPKSSYKHLIKGDIILAFNNTNLHQVAGYALDKKMNK